MRLKKFGTSEPRTGFNNPRAPTEQKPPLLTQIQQEIFPRIHRPKVLHVKPPEYRLPAHRDYNIAKDVNSSYDQRSIKNLPLLILNGRTQQLQLHGNPSPNCPSGLGKSSLPKNSANDTGAGKKWAVTGAFPAAPTRTGWNSRNLLPNIYGSSNYLSTQQNGFEVHGHARLEVTPASLSQSNESVDRHDKSPRNTEHFKNISVRKDRLEVNGHSKLTESNSTNNALPHNYERLSQTEEDNRCPPEIIGKHLSTKQENTMEWTTPSKPRASAPTLNSEPKHITNEYRKQKSKKNSGTTKPSTANDRKEKCASPMPQLANPKKTNKSSPGPRMKKVQSLEELQIYTSAADAKTAQIRVRQFDSEPSADNMSIVFHYPSTISSLNHFQVFEACTKALKYVGEGEVISISYEPLNVLLATSGLDDRWVIRLDSIKAARHLIKHGLSINDRYIYVELYNNVITADYNNYIRVQNVLTKKAKQNVKLGKMKIKIV